MNGGWSLRRLWLASYPFMTGAMAINLYMLSLIWVRLGLPILTPSQALAAGAVIAIPVAYAVAHRIRKLIDQSDRPL